MSISSNNPLSKHFRQPRLYIKLPSGGQFYPNGSLEMTENGEYPVLAMTAKDELIMKTPDALLNGQSTVSVIQSCMPNIKNAWHIPSIDLDYILIAIRIATYGETMDIDVPVYKSETNETKTYQIDLRTLLDTIGTQEYVNYIQAGDFLIEFAPLNYKSFTETALKTFEEQRIFRIVNDDDMSEVDKLNRFTESFNRLTELNIATVLRSVVSVKFQDEESVTNQEHIAEFFNNIDKNIYKQVIDHIDDQRSKFAIKPMVVQSSEEEIAAGAPETMEIPISFDSANFFA